MQDCYYDFGILVVCIFLGTFLSGAGADNGGSVENANITEVDTETPVTLEPATITPTDEGDLDCVFWYCPRLLSACVNATAESDSSCRNSSQVVQFHPEFNDRPDETDNQLITVTYDAFDEPNP